MPSTSLSELFKVNLSPSLVKEFLLCPRALLFRKTHHMSLIPSIEENQNNLAQEIVDNFTFGFFSDLKTLWS